MIRAPGHLEAIGCGYVVEGGWAASACGLPVESVDLDLVMAAADVQALHDGLLRVAGIQLDAKGAQESLGIDFRYGDEPNVLVRHPDLFYVPLDILNDRVQKRPLRVAPEVAISVPDIDVLALMKAKAFHDRRLLWEASRDPVAMAALDHDDQKWARRHDTPHWERKAGKDLFDLAFLAAEGAADHDWATWTSPRFVAVVKSQLMDPPLPLRVFAQRMAQRHGLDMEIPPAFG